MRKERIGKIGYRICAVLAAAVSLWCMGDNLWPVVKENGAAWALRAAGLQAATSQEVPQAEASPAPQKEAVKETEPEVTSLPTATPVPVQEKTDTELPVLPRRHLTRSVKRQRRRDLYGRRRRDKRLFCEGYFGLGA